VPKILISGFPKVKNGFGNPTSSRTMAKNDTI